MNRLFKLSCNTLVAGAVAATIAACGALEPNVIPVSTSTVTPQITAGGKVALTEQGNGVTTKAVLPESVGKGSIKQIFQTDRCSDLSRGGFVWFTDSVGFDDWLAPLSPELMAQVKSRVDFSKQGVLLLDYGIAGTGGAGSTVMSESLELKGSEAIVKVKRYEPSPTDRKKRAQVVTHPCSLHVMPRLGFSTLVVHSELGDRLTSFENSARR